MERMKIEMLLSEQELQDLLSAVGIWQIHLDKHGNPKTAKALERLRKRLWTHIRKIT